VQGTNGNLYGVANSGGVSSHCPNSSGCGTIFEITPGGKLTTLYNFCQTAKCADGALPTAGLTLATNGNFYGITPAIVGGGGTIFEITPTGKFTSLYSFCLAQSCPDGSGPIGKLMQAANGNLYGVTTAGGVSTHCAGAVEQFSKSSWQARSAAFTPFVQLRSAHTTAELRVPG
jgi:uncharacterized repeat protein (TIGR03803 family)